jgi:hypothetical protein
MTSYVPKSCGFDTANTPIIIYKEIIACYIRTNMANHISPKFFHPHEL